jgi:molybdopterin molybdotransferase
MAQLSNDCFAQGAKRRMTAAEALDLLGTRLAAVAAIEPVALKAAHGRILAEDVIAARAVPPHDNSAVDGYAVRFDDLSQIGETRLKIAGRAAAGHPVDAALAPKGAVRIFTGAKMPDGADTVMMQEDCREEDGFVLVPPGIEKGANRRRAGEDVAPGSRVLEAGRRLRPQDVGLAASIGRTSLSVYGPLRVALFSTGDEIREPGGELPPGCVYDANRYALHGLLETLGCAIDDLGILPDSYTHIHDALTGAAATHDAIVTSGGVSMGEEDHVRAAVTALGEIHFWQLAIRPGRPVALGAVGNAAFIGLPGNPAAMMVTFLRLARPALLRLAGSREIVPTTFRVRAEFGYKKKSGRREWVRCRLVAGPDGEMSARKFPREGAGILTSLVESDGLVELPEELTRLEPGTMVDFLPFSEVS